MAVLNERSRNEVWKSYVANVLYGIGAGLYGENYPIPAYEKVLRPDSDNDNQTGADIVEHIKKRLRGEE